MTAIVKVLPPAIFNRQSPIVVAVTVVKGPLVRQMRVCVKGTSKYLGTITNIQQKNKEVLEGVVGGVYAIQVEELNNPYAPHFNPYAPQFDETTDTLLECTV